MIVLVLLPEKGIGCIVSLIEIYNDLIVDLLNVFVEFLGFWGKYWFPIFLDSCLELSLDKD